MGLILRRFRPQWHHRHHHLITLLPVQSIVSLAALPGLCSLRRPSHLLSGLFGTLVRQNLEALLPDLRQAMARDAVDHVTDAVLPRGIINGRSPTDYPALRAVTSVRAARRVA